MIETTLGPIDVALTLHVGERQDGLGWGTVRSNYLVLREPAESEPARLIETWWCEGERWVELTLADNTLTGARDVPLNGRPSARPTRSPTRSRPSISPLRASRSENCAPG